MKTEEVKGNVIMATEGEKAFNVAINQVMRRAPEAGKGYAIDYSPLEFLEEAWPLCYLVFGSMKLILNFWFPCPGQVFGVSSCMPKGYGFNPWSMDVSPPPRTINKHILSRG